MAAQGEPLFHGEQDLADAEKADHRDEEVDAAEEFAPAEGHAQLARYRVHAHAGEQQSERHGDDGLVLLLAPEADEGAKGQEINREKFRRPEPQGKGGDARSEERDEQHGDQRADE